MDRIFNVKKYVNLRKKLRNEPTKSEVVLWNKLKGHQLQFKFRRQHGIGKYIVDFYCPKARLIVEIDGLTHADEKVFNNDQIRQKYLESLGLVVKRFSSQDIFYNLKQVVEDIYQTCLRLTTTPRPSSTEDGENL